jgi:hypothetical protein
MVHCAPALTRSLNTTHSSGVYFRDPDGHLLELLTPGVWSTY